MNKIDKEKKTISFMVELYCRHKLKLKTTPEGYCKLIRYAHRRLDHCKFGEVKKNCKQCPIHCYGRDKREQIREIMRWAGPRMFLYSPIAALKHLFDF